MTDKQSYQIKEFGKLEVDLVIQKTAPRYSLSFQDTRESQARCTAIPITEDAAVQLVRILREEKLCTILL